MGAGPAGQHNSINNQGSAPPTGSQIGPNMHHYRGLIPPFVSVLLSSIFAICSVLHIENCHEFAVLKMRMRESFSDV